MLLGMKNVRVLCVKGKGMEQGAWSIEQQGHQLTRRGFSFYTVLYPRLPYCHSARGLVYTLMILIKRFALLWEINKSHSSFLSELEQPQRGGSLVTKGLFKTSEISPGGVTLKTLNPKPKTLNSKPKTHT